MLFYKFILILCSCILFVRPDIAGNNEDKVVLSPEEIVDFVIKERLKENSHRGWRHYNLRKTTYPTSEKMTELNDDETRLKRRKVWSRWSKWGECSVTCGGGTKTRRRVCLAGRCAPDEGQEQRRPCARSPCSHPDTVTEDALDVE